MPNIDWTQIEGFREEMTAEERLDLFIKSPERENPALLEARSRIAELEADLNARMSEEEKAAAAHAATQKELEKWRRDGMLAKQKASYMAQGYDEKLAETAAAALIDNNHAVMFECMQKHQAAMEKRFKEQMFKGTPRPPVNEEKNEPAESEAEKLAKRLARRNSDESKSTKDALSRYT